MKQIFPLIFLLLFLGILLGVNIYLSKRFAWYFSLEPTWPLQLGFALLTLLMIVGVAAFTNATGLGGHLIYCAGAILMGVLLYLVLSVLVVDLARLVIHVPARFYGFAVLILTLSLSVYGILNAFNVLTREIEVEIPGLNRDTKAMHLTNEQEVDMVFITGDLFDCKIRFCDECLSSLKSLNAPVYFVEGNHDGYSGIERVKSDLRKVGVRVLSNEMATQGEIQIIGLNHMSADDKNRNMHANGHAATIQSILPGLPTDPEKPIILLHHSPHGIEYANQKGVDLYLSGHTHAGQLFPVNYIVNLIFRFNKGLHDFKGTRIFVGEGAGTFGPPMRLGTHSTITLIKLKAVR